MNSPSTIERHYSPPEIAESLRVDVHAVLGWIHSGQLVARKLGSGTKRPRFRVAQSALERFLESRETTPPTPRRRQSKPKPAAVDYVAMMRLGGGR